MAMFSQWCEKFTLKAICFNENSSNSRYVYVLIVYIYIYVCSSNYNDTNHLASWNGLASLECLKVGNILAPF